MAFDNKGRTLAPTPCPPVNIGQPKSSKFRVRLVEIAVQEWKLLTEEGAVRPSSFLLCLQGDPAGDPAAPPGARAGFPAHPGEGPAEPHAAGRAAAVEVRGGLLHQMIICSGRNLYPRKSNQWDRICFISVTSQVRTNTEGSTPSIMASGTWVPLLVPLRTSACITELGEHPSPAPCQGEQGLYFCGCFRKTVVLHSIFLSCSSLCLQGLSAGVMLSRT